MTSYVDVCKGLAALVARPAMHPRVYDETRAGGGVRPAAGPLLAIDASGVGRAAVDVLIEMSPPCTLVPITITGGETFSPATWPRGVSGFKVAKTLLIAGLLRCFEQRRFHVPGLPLAEAFRKELDDFELRLAADSGHETYGARQGRHDDLVLAAAVLVWACEGANTARPLVAGPNPLPLGYRGL
jgi:hypothetical protein